MANGFPWKNPNQERKELPTLLGEFRIALEEEIDAASRNSAASAIPLIDGKLVGQAAQARQYAFKLETVLNTPSDTPGELKVPNRPRINVTIVSIEGLRVVVSVEENLGEFVPKAWLQTDLSMLMKKLVQRIEDKSESANFAGDRMLGLVEVSGEPADLDVDPEEQPRLNAGQHSAVSSGIGRNLTAIWGPPGTGKTHTIGEIVLNLFRHNRSVLIVSHTNIAVDQAILKVAKAKGMHGNIEGGAVVRVGLVQNKELSSKFPDVLIRNQIDRKSEGLLATRELLTTEKSRLESEVHERRCKIDLCTWIPTGRAKLDRLTSKRLICEQADAALTELLAAEETSEEVRATLREEHRRLTRLLELRKLSEKETRKLEPFRADVRRLETRLSTVEHAIRIHTSRMEIADRIHPLRQERASYPDPSEQNRIISKIREAVTRQKRECATLAAELEHLESTLAQAQKHNALGRALRRLPNPVEQQAKVDRRHGEIESLKSQIAAGRQAIAAQEKRLARIIEIDSELSTHHLVGTRTTEFNRKRESEVEAQKVRIDLIKARNKRSHAEETVREIEEESQALSPHPSDLSGAYWQVCNDLHKISELPKKIDGARQNARDADEAFEEGTLELKRSIVGFEGKIGSADGRREVLVLLSAAFAKLEAQAAAINSKGLESEVYEQESRIRVIDLKVTKIDEKLAEVERTVINEASILGATLTKAYLSDAIQERCFDTVILDEASMAPIPALWVAASLARENIIIVGDFKQLPPICISTHKIAEKWLAKDIFEASGLRRRQDETHDPPSHFVVLDQQFRMRPEIAQVANLFYDGLLKSERAPKTDESSFLKWFNRDWKFDKSPVCQVNTSDLHAWVTSIPRGKGVSRLNFLSATLCVDLAEQILAHGRPRPEGGDSRILIVSPYQPHSKLIRLMIEQNESIRDEVESGTVHSFQGSEADVVIFDLVVDEPHWRANLFVPLADEGNKRLYNVAMTRARQRLIVVGNLNWCGKRGKNVFLGKTLLPFLRKHYPVFSAKAVIPNGLAGRAAKAQLAMLGGAIEANLERIVVTQSDFFPVLASDIERSQSRIVFYSPFLTQNRVSFLLPQLQAAIERNVAVYVVTKSHSERSRAEMPKIRQAEDLLQAVGVFILHKMRMHEKIVLIDDDITWSGSLNPMSFTDTQEVMERRKNKAVQKDYSEILRVAELLGICGSPESVCPVCGSPMVACEGNGDPFYWRCESDDCQYSRNIGAPYPTDGLMRCKTCEGELEFGEWGGKPHWRCCENKQHRMKIFRSHLRLPKMVALIPKKQCRKVFRKFDLKYDQSNDDHEEPVQGSLW